ncbi:MAG: F0F1 ATP synthase subunit A [Clostridia bacterium]|nr:F0F1 ATP synthase subunit A [Clostridia bacterium]
MKVIDKKFRIVDAFYILMMIIPIVTGIVLQVLTKPQTEGITITGARIFFTIPMPIQDFPVTESQINSALVLIAIIFLCLFLTHGIEEKVKLKRQHIAELIVEKVDGMVLENMGEYFKGYSPFIIAIMALSAFSSLMSLFGLFPPTSDINIVAGWAILVFFLITYYKLKCGPLYYLKSFTEPVAFLAPINFLSEFATPISMSFRHYGNVLSGTVISVLIATALAGLSNLVLGNLPGFLADIPLSRLVCLLFCQFTLTFSAAACRHSFLQCLQCLTFRVLSRLMNLKKEGRKSFQKIKTNKF